MFPPLITVGEAERVEAWIERARRRGARVLTGGRRQNATLEPTILADCLTRTGGVLQGGFWARLSPCTPTGIYRTPSPP